LALIKYGLTAAETALGAVVQGCRLFDQGQFQSAGQPGFRRAVAFDATS
jgi:hypothetical protein